MKAEVLNINDFKLHCEVLITHDEKELLFSVAKYGRLSFKQENQPDIFNIINSYWESLPYKIQTDIFEIYTRIFNILCSSNVISDQIVLRKLITVEVTNLLKIHNFDNISRWVAFKSNIIIPMHLDSEYTDSIDKPGSRNRTYLISDYIDLICLSILLRTMVPIWGEYMSLVSSEMGNSLKEYYAFKLLNDSEIINHKVFNKLETFINCIVGKNLEHNSSVVNLLSSEDLPMWVLSLTVIKRVCIADISGINPRANIVTYIHKFVNDIIKEDSTSEKAVKKKGDKDSYSPELDEKLSTLESDKIKHTLSVGQISEIELMVDNVYEVGYKLHPGINTEELKKALVTSEKLISYNISTVQITILKWLIKPIISPRAIDYLNKKKITELLGVAQAVLWAKDHKYLALLITSYLDSSDSSFNISGFDRKNQLTKENTAKINELFKISYFGIKKIKDSRLQNLVIQSIEKLSSDLFSISQRREESIVNFTWKMTAEEALITQFFGQNNIKHNKIPILPDIKNILADLIIKMAIDRKTKM